jgi:nucleoid DNA-binding protein/cell division protein FtsN
MKNGDFIKRVAKSSGVVEAETATILRALFELLARTLEKGIMVRLPGVGAFDVRQTAKRTVRNPSTGEKKEIPPRRKLHFAVAKSVANEINERYRDLETLVVAAPEEVSSDEIYFFGEKAPSAKDHPQVMPPVEENLDFFAEEASATSDMKKTLRPVGQDKAELSTEEEVDIDKVFNEIMMEHPSKHVKESTMPDFNLAEDEEKKSEQPEDRKRPRLRTSALMPETEEHSEEGKSRRWLWIAIPALAIVIGGSALFLYRSGYFTPKTTKTEVPAAVVTKPDATHAATNPDQPMPAATDTVSKKTAAVEARIDAAKQITSSPVTSSEKSKEAIATPGGKRPFTIQVSSWHRRSDAEKQVALLGKQGYDAYIEEVVLEQKRGRWHRVRVGHYGTEIEASRDAMAIRNLMGEDVIVTK